MYTRPTANRTCASCFAPAALLLWVLWAAVLPHPASATPSTLIWIPSGDVQPSGTVHAGIDDYFGRHGGHVPADFGITFGVRRAEIGVDVLSGADDVFLNAKLLVAPETRRRPQIAFGAYGLALTSAAPDYNMLYLIGAKTFPWGRVHLGLLRGSRAALGPDNVMLLAGVERQLSDKWWAAIDYQSGDSAFGAFSFGVAYTLRPGLSVLVGWDWYNADDSEDTLTVQLDWQWPR